MAPPGDPAQAVQILVPATIAPEAGGCELASPDEVAGEVWALVSRAAQMVLQSKRIALCKCGF